MSRSERIDTLLRVRRIQQQQAAAGLAERVADVVRAESALTQAREEYREHRHLDGHSGDATPAVQHHVRRRLHAESIPRRRAELVAAAHALDEQRTLVADRTGAVRGIERLDERIAAELRDEHLRKERKELDERTTRPRRAER